MSATSTREDRRLLLRYHEQGDTAAREELVERFLPLARQLARRYQRTNEPLDLAEGARGPARVLRGGGAGGDGGGLRLRRGVARAAALGRRQRLLLGQLPGQARHRGGALRAGRVRRHDRAHAEGAVGARAP